MAGRKTAEEKLQELNQKMEQLQNQKKQILAKQKADERKARTRRLIELGAAIEAGLGYSVDTPAGRKAVEEFIRSQEIRGKWVTKAIEEANIKASEESDMVNREE